MKEEGRRRERFITDGKVRFEGTEHKVWTFLEINERLFETIIYTLSLMISELCIQSTRLQVSLRMLPSSL